MVNLVSNTPNPHTWNSGLVGFWNFNGGYITGLASTAVDASGEGNDGTISGAVPTAGVVGQALSFDGIDDYVDAGNDASLNITGAITVEAWIYWKEYTANSVILSKFSQTYILGYQPSDDGKLYWHIYTDAWVILSVSVPKNEWHHLVGTYDKNLGSNQMKIYLDGELIDDATQTGSIDTQVGNLGIGIYYIGKPSPLYFNGSIDEVRIYNRALSADEIKEHYSLSRRNFKLGLVASKKVKITG